MRLHLVGMPHTQFTSEQPDCAFTQKARRFARMMQERGHELVVYWGDDCDVDVAEFVPCFPRALQQEHFQGGLVHADKAEDPFVREFNRHVIDHLGARLRPQEPVLITWGWPQLEVAQAFPDALMIEWAIGYGSRVLPHAVFDTYAWMHYMYGKAGELFGRYFDEAITGPFDANDFLPAGVPQDYLLFIGRLTETKGPHVAAEIAKRAGLELVACGRGDESLIQGCDVVYEGLVDYERRAELLQGATALLAPTTYVEPGGYVAVEAQMAGVPVIASPFGCFRETVQHGCLFHTIGEAERAVREFRSLERWQREAIQADTIERHGFERIGDKWDAYLERCLQLFGAGFYS